MTIEYEPVIGLEVHAQLRTRTKMFCACPAVFGDTPNSHVCEVCLGLPGALPVVNAQAVALGVKIGLALGCKVNTRSVFARKNYFYPDLPKGYQITQFDLPLCEGGGVEISGPDGASRRISIARAHLEEDAGKNSHGYSVGRSGVDLNRAGVPLIEIVSKPELTNPAEAAEYLRQLRAILMFAGANDGNLEAGSFRCDANVSVRPRDSTALGTRVEIKNVNSFRFVQRALEWEISAQIATLSAGAKVSQVTKTWNDPAGRCEVLRKKESNEDYRYFSEPDLAPVVITDAELAAIAGELAPGPNERRRRYQNTLGLSETDARTLTEHPRVAQYFETLVALTTEPVRAAHWVCNTVLSTVVTDGLDARFTVTEQQLAGLLARLGDGTLSGKLAKEVYAAIESGAESADAVIASRGLSVLRDEVAVESVVLEVLSRSEKQLSQYRAGKTALLGYFKGQVMKSTDGRVDPAVLDTVLAKVLAKVVAKGLEAAPAGERS